MNSAYSTDDGGPLPAWYIFLANDLTEGDHHEEWMWERLTSAEQLEVRTTLAASGLCIVTEDAYVHVRRSGSAL